MERLACAAQSLPQTAFGVFKTSTTDWLCSSNDPTLCRQLTGFVRLTISECFVNSLYIWKNPVQYMARWLVLVTAAAKINKLR
jgi:hypothetical protein